MTQLPIALQSGLQGRRRLSFIALGTMLLGAVALAGCTGGNSSARTSAATATTVAAAPPTATASASATTSPSVTAPAAAPVTATAAPTTAPTSAAAPGDAITQAVMAVVQRANAEQQQAMAQQDPTVMRDTATAAYYAQLAQAQLDMQNAGVSAIKLVTLQWGPVSVQGTSAQATTTETWQTSFADGSTEQSTDLNVYALVQQGSGWLIASDTQPNTRLNQPGPGTSPSTTPSAPPSTAASPGASQSRNWAGYAATGGSFTAVSGTWTVPQVSANGAAGGADATWVGIGGVVTHDLIQAGTQTIVVGPGQVRYSAWVEMLPAPSQTVPLAVAPGDVVTVSIAQQADGSWQISVQNQTTAQRYQTTAQYQSSLSSAEWIEEAPATAATAGVHVVTLDAFGSVTVQSGGAVEGAKQVTIAQAGGQSITMYGRGGQPIAQPSALGEDGGSFTVTRLNAGGLATAPPPGP